MKAIFTLGIVLSGMFLRDAIAAPSDNYWSMMGGQCQIDPADASKAIIVSGGTKFSGTQTGTIDTFCAVTKNTGGTNPTRMWLSYHDSDETGSNATIVLARLFRMNRSNPSVGGITQIGGDLDSGDTQACGSDPDNCANQLFTHTFDFDTYFYFVYVGVTRASSAQTAIFYGVGLDD